MSDKTIAQKLLVKANHHLLVLNPPEGYLEKIGELPAGANLYTNPEGKSDILQVFIRSKAELITWLPRLKPLMAEKCIGWVTYPKGTSGQKSDLNRDIIFSMLPDFGFTANALFSVDETWSAMRLKEV